MGYKDPEKQRAYQREWAKRSESYRAHQIASREARRKFVSEYKRAKGCMYCGEKEPVVLDLHHHERNKESSVSDLVVKKVKMSRIQEEIDKCVVVCANCHRKIHAGLL